jgi:hypothetical protein
VRRDDGAAVDLAVVELSIRVCGAVERETLHVRARIAPERESSSTSVSSTALPQ